jgi:hypothetical protein
VRVSVSDAATVRFQPPFAGFFLLGLRGYVMRAFKVVIRRKLFTTGALNNESIQDPMLSERPKNMVPEHRRENIHSASLSGTSPPCRGIAIKTVAKANFITSQCEFAQDRGSLLGEALPSFFARDPERFTRLELTGNAW